MGIFIFMVFSMLSFIMDCLDKSQAGLNNLLHSQKILIHQILTLNFSKFNTMFPFLSPSSYKMNDNQTGRSTMSSRWSGVLFLIRFSSGHRIRLCKIKGVIMTGVWMSRTPVSIIQKFIAQHLALLYIIFPIKITPVHEV